MGASPMQDNQSTQLDSNFQGIAQENPKLA